MQPVTPPPPTEKEPIPKWKQLINDCSDSTYLDLSNQNLSVLNDPADWEKMKHLVHLDLSNNKLADIPNLIGDLSNLEILLLGGNLLTSLPRNIHLCTKLTVLWANNNQLTSLKSSIGLLENLKGKYNGYPAFRLDGNENIPIIPDNVATLVPLKILEWLAGEARVPLATSDEITATNNLKDESTPSLRIESKSPFSPLSSPRLSVPSPLHLDSQQQQQQQQKASSLGPSPPNDSKGLPPTTMESKESISPELPNIFNSGLSREATIFQILKHQNSYLKIFHSTLEAVASATASLVTDTSVHESLENSIQALRSGYSLIQKSLPDMPNISNNRSEIPTPTPSESDKTVVPFESSKLAQIQQKLHNLGNTAVSKQVPMKLVILTLPEGKVRILYEFLTVSLKLKSVTKIHATERFILIFRIEDYHCDSILKKLREETQIGVVYGYIDVLPMIGSWPVELSALLPTTRESSQKSTNSVSMPNPATNNALKPVQTTIRRSSNVPRPSTEILTTSSSFIPLNKNATSGNVTPTFSKKTRSGSILSIIGKKTDS